MNLIDKRTDGDMDNQNFPLTAKYLESICSLQVKTAEIIGMEIGHHNWKMAVKYQGKYTYQMNIMSLKWFDFDRDEENEIEVELHNESEEFLHSCALANAEPEVDGDVEI